ncbi:MAG: hypothetical protein PHT43_07175 [Anaerolineaceae bacterium]|nr:hypothetical protein [Anaerolineaceae bacterium]
MKKAALSFEHFKGIYLPFWTYDTDTKTRYVGQRGEHYYVTEDYTTTEDGKSVTKSREVQKTRWYPATGRVHESFDDVLIPASESLPKNKLIALEPWDLENLVPFDPIFLGGFISEKYQLVLEQGFDKAKKIIDEHIERAVREHIGGDEQRIHSSKTDFNSITFKHILLPVYASAYKFKGKVFNFMVNARTGEIQGERPWSTCKFALTIIGALLLIGGGWLLYKYLSA